MTRIVLIARDWARDPIPPTTKKNSRTANRFGAPMFPSKRYRDWLGALPAHSEYDRKAAPIAIPVNCRALVYRARNVGDAVGYHQAIGDALEAMGIVKNDKWIVSWDGSRLLKDVTNPRVEIELTEVQ